MASKIIRKKYLLIMIFVALLSIVLLSVYSLKFYYVKYPNWTLITEYSESSHFSIIRKPNLTVDERVSSNELSNNVKPKTILLWTPFFGITDYVKSSQLSNCLVKNCIFTSNKSLLEESDAIVFHLRDLNLKDLPNYRRQSQRWILLHHESPPNTPNILQQMDGLINWTATYRYGSDIFLSPTFQRRSQPNLSYSNNRNYGQNKTRMIVWLVSNCKTSSNRERYVEELKKTVTVDVFGLCGDDDKQCLPKMSRRCLEKLSNEYRFILAFENSICRDYVTEKYFDTLSYDIIPVVFGGSDYRKIAPKKSFINALSYSSPRHLARYLLYLSKNHKQYNQYFKWKRDYELTLEPYSCQICRKLNNPLEPIKIWHNLNSWWFEESHCKSWSPDMVY